MIECNKSVDGKGLRKVVNRKKGVKRERGKERKERRTGV